MVNKQVLIGVPFLCMVLGAAGCKSVPQAEQISTAGLRIDVLKVKNEARRKRFDVRIKIWNDFEERISFDSANVRLLFNGREVAAKRASSSDGTPFILMHSNREFRWYFECGEEASPGSYQIEIRDIKKNDLPLGDTAVFSINV